MSDLEYKGYYDYKVEVYNGEKLLGTFQFVTNVWFLSYWLNIHFIYWKWTNIRVFHRLSGALIGEYSREGAIPGKPRI